jgi:hypothetical protein
LAFDTVLTAVNLLSVIATAALVVLTTKPCRASSVPYLLAIPAGFGLITVAFLIQVLEPFLVSSLPVLGLPVRGLSLLLQTYGTLFLVFAYARRTRFRFLGESTVAELLAGLIVTLAFFVSVFAAQELGTAESVPVVAELFLRTVIITATIYLMYETLRNWNFTHRASEGFVTVGFSFFLVEQLGFTLALGYLGSVATFLAYEGRTLGLFVLNAVLIVGVKKGDILAVIKRLGLSAPAHSRAMSLTMQES